LSLSLVRYANYREGIKLFIKKITDPRIKGQRKKQSIKELFKILRRQSARRIKNFRPFVFIGVF
ncbi:MAG TPA: hypothetical protein VKZ97_08725, partial [Flavobacteriaceae bacterium]|nr:hypothetical protein [Flavobacteriaceae bacterium]